MNKSPKQPVKSCKNQINQSYQPPFMPFVASQSSKTRPRLNTQLHTRVMLFAATSPNQLHDSCYSPQLPPAQLHHQRQTVAVSQIPFISQQRARRVVCGVNSNFTGAIQSATTVTRHHLRERNDCVADHWLGRLRVATGAAITLFGLTPCASSTVWSAASTNVSADRVRRLRE